jgi:hypothetical protein
MAPEARTGWRSAAGLVASNGFGMFVLGVAIALGAAFAAQSLARAMVAMRSQSTISVKGSASVDVRSDLASWEVCVSAAGSTREEAYLRLRESMERTERAVRGRGFGEAECTVSAVRTNPVMRRNEKGNETTDVERFELSQRLTVRSGRVDAVEAAARGITDLIRDGVSLASEQPVYTVSSIEEHKMRLLEEATRNAMERARTLAGSSGSAVGRLGSASQGTVQVLARGAIDGGEWGQYDTSTIDKTMRVVVSLEYAVQ